MPRKKTDKTKLTLTVDKNLVGSAKEIGINLSVFLEYQLRQYLTLLKTEFLPDFKWGRRDLNSGHRLPKPGG